MKNILFPALVLCLFTSTYAYAQTPNDDDIKEETERALSLISELKNDEVLEFSFGNPSSPALALAGLKTDDVTQVNQLRDFVITLPALSSGEESVAIDINPFLILNPIADVNALFNRYEKNKFQTLLDKVQINTVIRNGVEDQDDPEKSTKSLIALGFSSSILDSRNPLFNAFENNKTCESYIDTAKLYLNTKQIIVTPIDFVESFAELDLPKSEWTMSIAAYNSKLNQYVESLPGNIKYETSSATTEQDLRVKYKTIKKEVAKEVKKLNSELDGTPSKLSKIYNECNDAIKRDLASKPNLDIGGAVLWRSKNSEFGDFNKSGIATWVSGKKQFNVKSSNDWYVAIGASGRFSFSEEIATGDETSPFGKADTIQGWTGLEVNKEKWRLAARGGYVKKSFNDSLLNEFSTDGERWLVSADLLVAKNTWVSLSYGEANSLDEDLQGERFTVDLKFTQPKSIGLFK